MASSLKCLVMHFSSRRRWELGAIFVLLMLGAAVELVTISSVVPFLVLLTDDSLASHPPVARELFEMLGWIGTRRPLLRASVLFAAAACCAAAMRAAISWACVRFIQAIGADIGGKMYNRILHQPYSFHVATNTSTVIAGLNKVGSVTRIVDSLLRGLVALTFSAAILSALIRLDPSTAITSMLAIGILYFAVTILTTRRLKANGRVIAMNDSLRIQAVQEGLGGIRDILLDGIQWVYVDRFKKFDGAQRRARIANSVISDTPRYFIQAAGIVLIVFLAFSLSNGRGGLLAAIPGLGALALGAQRLIPQMQQFYATWASVQGNHAALTDVLTFLDRPLPPTAVRSRRLHLTDRIALKDVRFRYRPEGPDIIASLSLEIPRGSRLGIVGQTGSGKSTLSDIIMSLLEPTSGLVVVDGQVLDDANRHAWQACVAHVPQSIYLADTSIAENIALGTEPGQIDFERVRDVAARAQLATFIEGLPERYWTTIGERGIRLSGGQRQRIGLARALYKQADLLVLDEATSALDDATEKSVLDAIKGLGSELTVLMIAHRVSTLKYCSCVIELQGGRIARSGNFREALEWARSARDGSEAQSAAVA